MLTQITIYIFVAIVLVVYTWISIITIIAAKRVMSGTASSQLTDAESRLKARVTLSLVAAVLIKTVALVLAIGYVAKKKIDVDSALDQEKLRYEMTAKLSADLNIRDQVAANPCVVHARDLPDDPKSRDDCIAVSPMTAVEFVTAETTEWTNDPSDSIDTIAKTIPFLFPFENQTFLQADVNAKIDIPALGMALQFLEEAEKRADIEMGKNPAVESADSPQAIRLKGMHMYVQSIRQALSQGRRPILIDFPDVYSRDPKTAAAMAAFWKRALSMKYVSRYPGEQPLAFGPFFGAGGRDQQTALRPGYPVQSAKAAALCATCGTFDNRGKFTEAVGRRQPFCTIGDRFVNRSKDIVYMRMFMNDEVPSDNSETGKCVVHYRLVPVLEASH